MDIIKTLEKYNLTLRRLPDVVADILTYDPTRPAEVVEMVAGETTTENFAKMQKKGCYNFCRFNNGYIIRKYNRIERHTEGGWLVKIDNGAGSVQRWDKKNDFYGKTPKEAICAAVEYIEKVKEEKAKKMRLAGLL